jgi:sulfur-oxidizing protein SoxX
MTRRMKFTLGAIAAVALSTAAVASEVSPEAVEFTDDGVACH